MSAIFSAATLRFLRDLKRHNDRDWFAANRERYEADLRAPLRAMVEELDVRFARFAPEIIGDPKRSIFRIHRDTRFSADKSPYKTHGSCWFMHRDGSHRVGSEAEGGGAGFYFQIAPGDSFIGAGIWMPPRPMLNRLREAIAEAPAAFGRIARDPAVKRRFGGLDREAALKRMPRGFADDHPAAEWLKLQSFTVGRRLTDAQAISAKLPALVEADYRRMLPLVRWLNTALGLRQATAR